MASGARRHLLSSKLTATSSSTASSPPLPRSLLDALSAAKESARVGTLRAADAHGLFDELLRQPTGVPERAINGFLAALAHAPLCAAYGRDGPALAVALFNRMSRVAQQLPTACTYSILINCCGRAHLPDLALAFFGRLPGRAWASISSHAIAFSRVCVMRTGQMRLSTFCKQKKSLWAIDLLRTMAKKGGVSAPNVVSYNTVIDGLFKEGKIAEACGLFHEMVQQGTRPCVVTYNSIVHALCKARAMDKAEVFFRQMVDKGVQPNIVTYANIIHGYSSLGHWKAAVRVLNLMVDDGIVPNHHIFNILINAFAIHGMMDDAMLMFQEMKLQEVKPDVVTYGTLVAAFCRMGRLDDAMDIFSNMTDQGVPPNEAAYYCLIQSFCSHGGLVKVKELVSEMIKKGFHLDVVFFSSVINNLCKEGKFMVH
nr:unnamed protein product [Digitaria exilis]